MLSLPVLVGQFEGHRMNNRQISWIEQAKESWLAAARCSGIDKDPGEPGFGRGGNQDNFREWRLGV